MTGLNFCKSWRPVNLAPFGLVLGYWFSGNALYAHCIENAEELIEAINRANERNEDHTIDLCDQTITLENTVDTTQGNTGLPGIGTVGSTYTLTIIDGTIQRDLATPDHFRLLLVNATGNLVLEDVTLLNGLADVPGNPGALGGGILSLGGPLSLENCTVSNNTANEFGGGIFALGPLTINNSTISNNSSPGPTNGVGGGLLVANGVANTISNSTFFGNTCLIAGAGVSLQAPTAIFNSTFFNNNTGPGGFGGAIEVRTESLTLSNSTLSGNHAGFGGGLAAFAPTTVITSIIAGNTAQSGTGNGPDIYEQSAHLAVDGDYNVIGTADGNSFTPGTPNANNSWVGTGTTITTEIDPKLGPLQDNGGPTLTMELFSNSPAIGIALATGTPNPNPENLVFDQRGPGFPRTTFGYLDAGAVQSSQVNPEGPQGDRGEEGRSGENGLDGNDVDWIAGPVDLPELPIVPPVGAPPVEGCMVDEEVVVGTRSPSTPVGINAEVAPGPVAPKGSADPEALDGAAGCSQVAGIGQAANSLWFLLMLAMFGARRLYKARARVL